MIYDLHIHSNKSDGKYDRFKIIKHLIDNKFEYVSFTDHNYISNLDVYNSFIKNYKDTNLKLINGIEFDIQDIKFMHILGYGIKNLQNVSEILKSIEIENIEICKRLILNLKEKYNFDISFDEIKSNYKQISKGSIRDLLVKKGYVDNHLVAGDLYTGKNSYCYEQTKSLTYEKVINLIKSNGGISVLAHPSTLNFEDDKLTKFIASLKEMGLDGIEVLNTSKTTNRDFDLYREIAFKLDLLESCGSDFHRESNQNIGIDNEISKKLIYKLEEG